MQRKQTCVPLSPNNQQGSWYGKCEGSRCHPRLHAELGPCTGKNPVTEWWLVYQYGSHWMWPALVHCWSFVTNIKKIRTIYLYSAYNQEVASARIIYDITIPGTSGPNTLFVLTTTAWKTTWSSSPIVDIYLMHCTLQCNYRTRVSLWNQWAVSTELANSVMAAQDINSKILFADTSFNMGVLISALIASLLAQSRPKVIMMVLQL